MLINNSTVVHSNFLRKFKLNIKKTRIEFNFVKKNFNRIAPLLKYYTKSNPFKKNLNLKKFFRYKNRITPSYTFCNDAKITITKIIITE